MFIEEFLGHDRRKRSHTPSVCVSFNGELLMKMSCGTSKHVCVDYTITLLRFGVVEHSVKLVWVTFSNNAKPTILVVV